MSSKWLVTLEKRSIESAPHFGVAFFNHFQYTVIEVKDMRKETKVQLGVPVIEYGDGRNTPYLGVVFLIHGHTGNKLLEGLESIPEGFVQRGYFVISLDAYKHGDRKEEPYFSGNYVDMTLAMPEVVYHTVMDVIRLYDEIYHTYGEKYIVTGTSMGGHISFQMPKYDSRVDVILPYIGSPDIPSHYHQTKKDFLGEKIALCEQEVQALAITDLSVYVDKAIGITNGNLDHVVEIDYVIPFVEALRKQGHRQLFFASYPVGHQVTQDMVQAQFAFFDTLFQ